LIDLTTIQSNANETLAASALAAPAAGFGNFEKHPDFSTKVAVLLATDHCFDSFFTR
jgi:hypothetical protein